MQVHYDGQLLYLRSPSQVSDSLQLNRMHASKVERPRTQKTRFYQALFLGKCEEQILLLSQRTVYT